YEGSRRAAADVGVDARAFTAAPAVIAAEVHPVDFLHCTLAYVADPKLPVGAVEAPAKGIAHSERENFRAGLRPRVVHVAERLAEVRVGIRNAVGSRGSRNLDAQHLAEQRVRVLRVADRAVLVVPAAAIADACEQETAGPECEVAAVMVAFVVRLRRSEE